MDQVAWVAEYGWWGLAAAAFLGATLVPVSSEIAVVTALKLGMPAWQVLLSASVGNSLGASLNYVLGWLLSDPTTRKLSATRIGRSALHWTERFGKWSLLGSWLPVIGDPLCLAAGLFRISLPFFAAVGIGSRILRYVLLVLAF